MTTIRTLLLSATFLMTACATHGEAARWHKSAEPGLIRTDVENRYGQIAQVHVLPEYKEFATESMPLLKQVTTALADALLLSAPETRWADVLLTDRSGYVQQQRGDVPKWPLSAEVVAARNAVALREQMYSFVAHEQVHRAQRLLYGNGQQLPRWFSEGMAEWVSLHAMQELAPGVVEDQRKKHAEVLRGFDQPVSLGEWGGLRPKRGAIRRQVSAEEQRKMDADASYMPPGPYRFGPGDFEEDSVPHEVRYAAAMVLFDSMGKHCGERNLLDALSGMRLEKYSNGALAGYLERACDFDISPRLE